MGRNPFKQPYLSTSIWNIPIGSAAVYANPQPTSTQASLFPATIKTLTTDANIVLMDPSQPITNLAANTSGNRCFIGTTLTTVPMALNYEVNTGYSGSLPPTTSTPWLVPSSTNNNACAAVKADGITVTGGDAFARCTIGSPGTLNSIVKQSGSLFDAALGTSNTTSDGPWHGGSGLNILGGCIRLGELVPNGSIPHAIKINLDGGKNFFNGFVWPAYKKDSYSYSPGGTNPKLAPGSLLALTPSTLAGMTFATGSTGPAKILATAFCHYGAYIVNDAARSVNAIDTEFSPYGYVAEPLGTPGEFQTKWGYPFATSGVGGSAWANDIAMIFAALKLVTSNTFAQYNTNVTNYNTGNPANYTGAGGGAPLVAFAPPLGGSTNLPTWSNEAISSETFRPVATTQGTTFNPMLQFAALSSEVFDVSVSAPTHIGPTIACGTASLPQMVPMRVN
jgi:hypothetical protein